MRNILKRDIEYIITVCDCIALYTLLYRYNMRMRGAIPLLPTKTYNI